MTWAGRYVGQVLPRADAAAKVTGRARYVADLDVPGAWWGGALRADVARGTLLGIDRDATFDWSRVVVVGPEHIPGANVIALIADDWPVLAPHAIEHWGEPLLLVAAPDRETLHAALAALHPRIAPQEPLLDPEQATVTFKAITIEKGDVGEGFAQAAHVVEGEYRTDSQEQLYIEPQGMIAWPPDAAGVVTVQGSLQCPYYVQKALVKALALPPQRARVVSAEVGGGFGGKEDYPSVVAVHAALLSQHCGRPVKLIYDRHEDLLVTPKRHPSRVRHRTAVSAEGQLLAMAIDVLLDGGAYTTLSPVVLSRALLHATGPYRCEHVTIRGRVVKTNHVPYGAFRGFGAPQTCFAIERQMDRIARALDLHPGELRRRNLMRVGSTTATGQILDHGVAGRATLHHVLAASRFHHHAWGRPRTERTRKRRGLGLSCFFHGAGFTGSGELHLQAKVDVELDADGRALVRAASTEIGQGTVTMFQAIAAEALGAEWDDVTVQWPDTAAVPDSGPTVASRTCMVVGGCVRQACQELRLRLGEGDAPFRERARAFVAAGGARSARATYRPPPGIAFDEATYRGDAYPVYAWGADVAEVEVDLDTFEVELKRLWTAIDCGKAIQPQLVEGQIEGGTLQALGWAHLEVVTATGGRFAQDRLATCIIPTALDAPPIDVHLVEDAYPHGPFGAKGIGELPMDGGAPAVVAAIEDALGIAIDRIPATPERLLEAWQRAHPEDA